MTSGRRVVFVLFRGVEGVWQKAVGRAVEHEWAPPLVVIGFVLRRQSRMPAPHGKKGAASGSAHAKE